MLLGSGLVSKQGRLCASPAVMCEFVTGSLSQVERSPKPVASCAMPAAPGMNIKTDTPLVKKAREGVMEFMLVGSRASHTRADSPSAVPLANALDHSQGFP